MRTDERNKIISMHRTDHASIPRYPTAEVNCLADWRSRREILGTPQKYLLGPMENADRIRAGNLNSYPAWLPPFSLIARGFF